MAQLVQEGANFKAAKVLGKLIAVVIILAVAALGDVMYIIEMSKVFTGQGILLTFCYLGAFTSFMAIGYLLLGKSMTFRPGGQMLAAWVVFAAELLIIALNILLVFNPDRTGFIGAWAYISPATPVLHMLGISLIFFLDPDLAEKHKDMEMQAKLNDADREYQHAVEMAKLNVKRRHLEYTVAELEAAVNSPESLARIQQHALSMNDGLLTQMSGRTLPQAGRVQSISEEEAARLDQSTVDNRSKKK